MLNKISFEEFMTIVDETYNEHSFSWRYGQTIMNVLHKVWPEKYNKLVATENDCYYDDGMVRITLNKLEREWMKS